MAEEKVKQTEKEQETQPQKRTLTVFGPETDFDGVLEFSDDLIITGRFKGRINATGNLDIAKGAVCKVEKLSAKSVVISGTLEGDIENSEWVEICSGGSVKGDIVTARLRIENNVDFEGQVTMLEKIPEDNLFLTASSEFKQAMVLRSDVIE